MSPNPSNYSRWRPHPWHGLSVGPEPPGLVSAYIEITPFSLIKYEIDKVSGYLRIDRPQRTSSIPPTVYGFIPRTYCGLRVGRLSPGADDGDGDPMDICVFSERQIDRAEILLDAQVIGGFQMIDGGKADDKIIAVLDNDGLWGGIRDVNDMPHTLIERLEHYFLTYKLSPDAENRVHINRLYGPQHAQRVVQAAIEDYQETFGNGEH